MTNDQTQFTRDDISKALAIVNIFETGRPFGEYSALAVLNDGAGISFGISQFTHRSGSLADVVSRYIKLGGQVGAGVLQRELGLLRSSSTVAVALASQNSQLRNALRAAGATREMRAAQNEVAYGRYLRPAIAACAASGFVSPLALAVIYDSVVHGSWPSLRDRIRIPRSTDFEKAWVAAYVRARHAWLRSIPRLRPTAYRTSFFLSQIIAGNWQLELPVTVHGYRLTLNDLKPGHTGGSDPAAGHHPTAAEDHNPPQQPAEPRRGNAFPAENARPQADPILKRVATELGDAFARYDRIEALARTAITRTDAAKSLWTTVLGTVWQTFWAVVSFLVGLPREVWLVVAVIAAALTLAYLYRQFALGRIREIRGTLAPGHPGKRQEHPAQLI